MLTIAQALEMQVLSTATVVAGRGGSNKIVWARVAQEARPNPELVKTEPHKSRFTR